MKIAIIGYSGCGKSTLARYLSQLYQIPVLYLDSVNWLSGWKDRNKEESAELVREFLDSNDFWIIDGNYSYMEQERRMAEADKIIFLSFNRFSCLYRAFHRYVTYRGKTRESMGKGCREKLDFEFIWWILHEGRSKRHRKCYQKLQEQHIEKFIIIKNQKQLTEFKNQCKKLERNQKNTGILGNSVL